MRYRLQRARRQVRADLRRCLRRSGPQRGRQPHRRVNRSTLGLAMIGDLNEAAPTAQMVSATGRFLRWRLGLARLSPVGTSARGPLLRRQQVRGGGQSPTYRRSPLTATSTTPTAPACTATRRSPPIRATPPAAHRSSPVRPSPDPGSTDPVVAPAPVPTAPSAR